MYQERLIIFTRYPEPGKTKTRLIPALGQEGAAALQRQMTEHTIAQVNQLIALQPLSVEVWFTGGDRTALTSWLGPELDCQPQGEGDLGGRLLKAFTAAFAVGLERVITIGTDCPGLDAVRMTKAFQALHQHDLVLGPATDGGYYLIGLRHLVPDLFRDIHWGTAEVLKQTVAIAQRLNLSVAYLDPLTDIDRPEDLGIWQEVTGNVL